MNITRQLFTKFRTPDLQSEFYLKIYNFIQNNQELKHSARLHKEPYKTFIEEFMPFSWFCEWKYGGRKDVECALVEGTPGRDGIVRKINSKLEHNVEITWPIDGLEKLRVAETLKQKETTDLKIWDYDDTSMQEEAALRTISIAKKKELRDYRSEGGSTLIFVFDSDLFKESNIKHKNILDSLIIRLHEFNFIVDNVLLILVPRKKMIVIKEAKQNNGAEE